MTAALLTVVLLLLAFGCAIVATYARVVGVEELVVPGSDNGVVGTPEFSDTCGDCKRVANAPACAYFCNMNAINVPHEGLDRLNGLYKVKHDSSPDVVRWILALQCGSDGVITGFSTVRRGPRYQDYDVSGVYIGNDTMVLLLSSRREEAAAETETEQTTADESYLLSDAADPEAVGLKLRIVGQGNLLTGSTTGQTYLDPDSPIALTFERTDHVPADYFQDGAAPSSS